MKDEKSGSVLISSIIYSLFIGEDAFEAQKLLTERERCGKIKQYRVGKIPERLC